MKKFIIAALVLITLSAHAQEAFVLGKTYSASYVVWWPVDVTPRTYWRVPPIPGTFVAKSTPDRDPAHWQSYTYPVVTKTAPAPSPVPDPVVSYASKSSLDSLSKFLSDRLKAAEEKVNAMSTIKAYQGQGAFLRVSKDTVWVPRLIFDPSTGLQAIETDSLIKVIKK